MDVTNTTRRYTLKDIDSMPKELRAQLSKNAALRYSATGRIIQVLEKHDKGSGLNPDELLVEYYNEYQEVIPRTELMWRMAEAIKAKKVKRLERGLYGAVK